MKKFIAAFDGLKYSESTMEYAIRLASEARAHLVGVFLEDFTRHSYSVAQLSQYEGETFDKHLQDLRNEDSEERQKSIDIFKQACMDQGINHSVHRDRNIALQELLHESIYADLMIISSRETMTRYPEPSPTRFIREVLSEAQCPVLVVPDHYRPVDKVVLLYDGAPSSVFALRTFSYLFDFMSESETEILTVREKKESMHMPDGKLIKEFAKRHYPSAEYVVLKGHPEEEIIRHLKSEQKAPVVVLGAYKRGKLSRMFRPSMADHLLQDLPLPLFIAHNRS